MNGGEGRKRDRYKIERKKVNMMQNLLNITNNMEILFAKYVKMNEKKGKIGK